MVVLRSGYIELDEETHQVRITERPVDIAPRVFDLLRCLMRRAPETVNRTTLRKEVWGAAG